MENKIKKKQDEANKLEEALQVLQKKIKRRGKCGLKKQNQPPSSPTDLFYKKPEAASWRCSVKKKACLLSLQRY